MTLPIQRIGITLTLILSLAAGTSCINSSRTGVIEIDANGNLNANADQVGIWVNSTYDEYSETFVNQLKYLKMKSIRHGWQYTIMDPENPDIFYLSPCAEGIQGQNRNDDCTLREKLPFTHIERLMEELDVPGWGIIGMDGIMYMEDEDPTLPDMTMLERQEYYIENARNWVRRGKQNNFEYFELGNENDLAGEMGKAGNGVRWTGTAYARYAKKMAIELKKIDPTIKVGINGGFGASISERESWWEDIIKGAPDINEYIDFIIIHKYEFGLFYPTWKEEMLEYGRRHNDTRESIKKHFPGKPIHVTETSGWQNEGGFVPHYRCVLNVEMLGNIFMDPEIEHLQHWGTRWDDWLVFDADSDSLNPIGLSLAAYTRFAKPLMVDNGMDGKIRYFAAKNPEDKSMTVWLINHAETARECSINILGFAAGTENQVWRLTSPENDPMADSNELWQGDPVEAKLNNASLQFKVEAHPTSVTVITFN